MAEQDLIIVCKNCSQEINYLREKEKGMGYIECPKCKCSIDQSGNVFAKPQIAKSVQDEINQLFEEHKLLHSTFELNAPENYYEFQNYYDRHEALIKELEIRNSYHESKEDFLDDYRKFEKQEFKFDDKIALDEIIENLKSFKIKDPFIYISKDNALVINATREEFGKSQFLKLATFKVLKLMPRRHWGALKFLKEDFDGVEERKPICELSCLRVDAPEKLFESAYSDETDFLKAASTLNFELLKNAQFSLVNDSIELNKFFAHLSQDSRSLTTENIVASDFIDKDYPLYVGKFISGTICEIHKDGDAVKIYSRDGKDLTESYSIIIKAIKDLSADGIVLLANLDDCGICHIDDVLYCDRDVHKLSFSKRKKILDSLSIKKSSFIPKNDDYPLNKSPYILCRKREELETAINRLLKDDNSCGVVVRSDMQYSLKYQQPGVFIYDSEIKKDVQLSHSDSRSVDKAMIFCDFLNCEIKDVFIKLMKIPFVEAGNIFNAIQEKTKKFNLIEIRNFSSYEIPPLYQEIRLKKNLSKTFLTEGTQFYYDDLKSAPLIIQRSQTWGGYLIKFIAHIENMPFVCELNKQISDYARENNFLKGEKFSVCGEFLDDQDITWDDLKLTSSIKDKLKKLESLIVKNDPSLDSRGLIFIGPPGCGKTLTGKLLSKMSSTFIWVTAKDCSEMGATYAFSTAFELARELRPTILFMEDIDSYIEYGMVDLLKTELDGMKLNNGVFTILTSNFPEKLPEALIDRPGRFHDIIYFTLPNKETRKEMFIHFLKEEVDSSTIESILKNTEGFSGAHIKEICRFAQILRKEDKLDLAQALLKSLEKSLEQRKLIQTLKNRN